MGRLFTFERRLALGALLATVPGLLLAAVLAWRAMAPGAGRVLLVLAALALSVLVVVRLRSRLILRLKTLSNLVSALREGDYSVRGRDAERDDPLGEVAWEVNALGDQLRTQRLGELEASALLGQVLEEIDVAISPRRTVRSLSPSAFTSQTTSPTGSARSASRPRTE